MIPVNSFGEYGKCGVTKASHGELGVAQCGGELCGAVDGVWLAETL
jgi:hypothetical protein